MNIQHIKTELARCQGTIEKISKQTKSIQDEVDKTIKSHQSSSQFVNSVTRCLEYKLFAKLYKRATTTNRAVIVVPYPSGVLLLSKERGEDNILKLHAQFGVRNAQSGLIDFNSPQPISMNQVQENDYIEGVYVNHLFLASCGDTIYVTETINGQWNNIKTFGWEVTCLRAHDREVDLIGYDNELNLCYAHANVDTFDWDEFYDVDKRGNYISFDYDKRYNILVCGYYIDNTNRSVHALLFRRGHDTNKWSELPMNYIGYYWNQVTFDAATENWVVSYGQITNGSSDLVDKMLSLSVDSNTLTIRPNMSTKYEYALTVNSRYADTFTHVVAVVKTKEGNQFTNKIIELIGNLWVDSSRVLELTGQHEPLFATVDNINNLAYVSTVETSEKGYKFVLYALGYPITEHIKHLTTEAIKNQL